MQRPYQRLQIVALRAARFDNGQLFLVVGPAPFSWLIVANMIRAKGEAYTQPPRVVKHITRY